MTRHQEDIEKMVEAHLDHLGTFDSPLAEDVTRSRERTLDRLRMRARTTTRPAVVGSGRTDWKWRPAAIAAAAAVIVIAAVGAATVWRSEEQPLFRIVEGNVHRVETIRSNGGGGAVLALSDGSRIEMRSQSDLSLEPANDGVRIRLHTGGIIVNAAKQRSGHLYVQTKDVTVSVVGTVFLVNAEAQGSRVAVLEGEVRVQQGATDRKLLSGQQVATSPLMTAPTLSQEIAWSRNAPAHLALLQQSVSTSPLSGSSRRSVPLVSPAEPRLTVEEATPFAQTPAAGGSQQSRFLQVDVVTVDAIVRDSSGQQLLDLRASDFKVFENTVEQTVESFALVKDVRDNATPYYLLSYRSTTAAPAGSYRRIRVLVDRPGVRVESREGYYAQDSFSRGAYAEDEVDLVAPVLRERREPSYTSDAIRARIQGSVVVEAVVGVDGRVSRSRVVSSLDKTFGLDDEALKAVSQWTFRPGELKGQAVPVLVRLVVTFRLR